MAVRTDLIVDFQADPRIATIAAPATEIPIQDIVDTLRTIESSFTGMSFPSLLDAEGKANLGGGLFTGITYTGQNVQIGFESRFTPAESGTVTTASGAPNTIGRYSLIDSAADFVASNIARGSVIINYDDQSVTEVVNVFSTTELEVKALQNGLINQFSIGDNYDVFNIEQVSISGGNTVAVDENDLELNPVLGTFGTQITVEKSTSAALLNVADLTLARELLEADQVFDQSAQLLYYYRRGTANTTQEQLIPPKRVVTTQTVDTSLKE